MTRLGIIGLGLMGGSLGMALKQRTSDYELLGYARRAESRRQAIELGAVDQAFDDLPAMVPHCDLLLCCLPVMAIAATLKDCIPHLKPGAIVSDVGSTKAAIAAELGEAFAGQAASFVGSHPICGSEMQGIESARADLYEGAVCVLTPTADSPPQALARLSTLWRAAGCRVLEMDAGRHDRILARTSHLPHLAAALLSAVVAREDAADEIAPFCGTGYRDATRLAAGSPLIWKDIIASNRPAVCAELRALADETGRLLKLIESGELDAVERWLAASAAARELLIPKGVENS
jgi:prephenate dehydrogenase